MLRSRLARAVVLVAILSIAGACSGDASRPPDLAPSTGPADRTDVPPSPSPSAPDPTAPVDSAAPMPFSLGEPGPYHVGTRSIAAEDAARDHRPVAITLWYPAVRPDDASDPGPTRGAAPDPGGAPYPLILSSTKMADLIAPIVVSHGFAWASVDGIDSYRRMGTQMIDQPLDILLALDIVTSDPPKGMEGLIDGDRAGAIGYSFDGYNALALSGAQIDPAYYLAQCPTPDALTAPLVASLSAFDCGPANNWAAFVARVPGAITATTDGLWQPMTDPRIRAVMPLAGEGWWLFGERGLAAVDRPALLLVGGLDELYPENALMFRHLGTPDRSLIVFDRKGHMMILEQTVLTRLAHFTVAFFGHHLQGREDMARSYSEAFVAGHDDLTWVAATGD